LALGAVTLLVYWPVRHFDFLNWDDLTYVSTNDHVRGGLTWNGLIWSFTHSYSSNWHPLTWLSHMLDCQLYGLNPAGHHLTNVLFHTANSVLLFLLLSALTAAAWRSAFVAALFALHPLHVESVAWIAERKDVLSALFFFLTLWAYARYTECGMRSAECGVRKPEATNLKSEARKPKTERSPKTENRRLKPEAESAPRSAIPSSRFEVQGSRFKVRWYWVALGMFALGLMSKPMLVTLPFVLLLLDYWPLRRLKLPWFEVQDSASVAPASAPTSHLSTASHRISGFGFRTSFSLPLLVEKAPFFALSAASCLITFLAQKQGGAVAPLTMLSLDARIANAAVAYVQYLAKLFWPVNLSPLYPHPDHWGPWLVTGAAALLICLTAAVWRGRRRFPYALTGWLWFLGTLVPVIGIVQVGSQAFADRYTYLPLVGIMVALVWLGAETTAKSLRHPDPWKLSEPADDPSPALKGTLSPCKAERGLTSITGPIQACRSRAVTLLPVVLSLALLAALAWRTREQLAIWKDTGALFGHALALTPNNVQALYGLGVHLVDAGRIGEGKQLLEEAIRLQPAYPEALGAMASTLDGQGKYEEAIRFYQAALKAQPNQDSILNNLAWLLASCPDAAFRNGPEAVRLASRACELTGYARPLLIGTLAAAQAEAGNFPAAIATAEQAAALATALRLEETAAKNRELIQLYRLGQPFHEKRESTTDGHR
jgi:hypothetical protein